MYVDQFEVCTSVFYQKASHAVLPVLCSPQLQCVLSALQRFLLVFTSMLLGTLKLLVLAAFSFVNVD